ncbi:MAG: hypothetical protein HKN37_08080 [Rhodothermales bacterium]|nr:hypothetical protein [Rhodothermales bacterium]
MKKNTVAASVAALLLVLTLYGCDSYEAPITGADDTAAELSESPFTPPSRTGPAKEYNDHNGPNALIGDYEVTLTIPDGTLFGDKIDTYVWTVEYVGDDANDKINHFAITLDECAAAGFDSNDDGFNSNSSTEFDVQWHPSEGQGGPYVFTGQYPAGQGRWIGYGTAEIKTSGNQKFDGTILLPCMNTTTIDASVFFDDDRSGTKGLGEAGQPGITVELRDADNEGVAPADPDNEVVAIETSGADGVLLFEGVFIDGDYTLALPPSVTDLWLTTNLPDAVNVVGPTPTSSPIGLDKYDVKGFVYAVDAGGLNPAALPSVNIELWQGSVKVADATSTAIADLNYVLENVFGNLLSTGYDEYQIRIPKSTNSGLYSAYVPLSGVTTTSDGSAVINGVRVGGEINAGCGAGNSCGNDIGFEPALYDISGFVSIDPRNTLTGTIDEIVVAGIPDVTVELLSFEGGVCSSVALATQMTGVAYAVTPDSGDPYAENYVFADVPAGTYCISIPEITDEPEDFNESLAGLYTFKGVDVSGEPGAQLLVTVGPDSARNDFPWEAEPDLYTSAFRSNPDYTIFSLGVTEWLNKFKTVCRTGDDLIPYKDRFKVVQPPVSAAFLINHLNTFLYPTVPPTTFQNACDVADALSQPLAEGRNNVDELSKLYWQLIAAELNYATPKLGLVLNPAGEEDGPIPENMLRYMERFLEQELFGAQTAAKVSSTYSSESGMLSSYNGGGGGGGGTGFE